MSSLISSKMCYIAKQLNQLNEKGNVKYRGGNEKGYAKVIEIKSGCSIWVHHLLNNNLIIDLSVRPKAEKKHPEIIKNIISKFTDFFKGKVIREIWQHSEDKNITSTRYCFDITELSLEEIMIILNKIKEHFTD